MITKKINNRNCESGLAIISKHAAHRLAQHTLQVVEMAWTDDNTGSSHLLLHALAVASTSSDFDTGTVNR